MPDTTHERREEVFNFLRAFIRQHGFAPTPKQIAKHLGIKVESARHQVTLLHREGRITLGEGGYTQIDVINDGRECLRCHQRIPGGR